MRLLPSFLIIIIYFFSFSNAYGQDSTKAAAEVPPPPPLSKPILTREIPSMTSQIQGIFKQKEKSTNLEGEPNLKWGQVENEYLKMTSYKPDTLANVILLLSYANIDRGFQDGDYGVSYNYHYRIKVIDKSKYSGGEIELLSTDYNKIIQLNAQTINWTDGAVERIKVKEILTDDQNGGSTLYRFSFPEIKDGSVLEYKYQIFCPNSVLIEPVYFQSLVPTVWSELKFLEMDKLEYKIIPLGGKHEYFHEGEETVKGNNFHDGGTEYRWIMKDVPSIDYEEYTNSIENHMAKMAIQLHAYEVDGNKQYIFKDWEAYCKLYNSDEDAMLQVEDAKQVKKLMKDLKKPLATAKSDKDKMILIFNYLRDNINWNGRFNIYITADLKTSYKFRSGSSADINFMLLAALKKTGIKAYPILLSTREHGHIHKGYPLAKQFDQVIIQAEIGNEIYILDGTLEEFPYNLLPYPDLNYEGLLIKDGKREWIDINAKRSDKIVQVNMEISDEGTMVGTFEYKREGYGAFSVRQDIEELGYEKYQKRYFSDIYPESNVTNLKFQDLEDNSKILVENMDFKAENACQVAGDLMYFDLCMGLGFSESVFRTDKRTQPVERGYPLVDDYTFRMKLPESYKMEELPADLDISLPNNAARYTFKIIEKDGYLEYNARLEWLGVYYEVSEFGALKDFMEQVVEKQTAQVVLKKK